MHLVKKIEIIVSSFELNKILAGLKNSGVYSYAVFHNVAAEGWQGENFDMMMEDNVYILAFCKSEELKLVLENIKPLLSKFGGNCYISDIMEVRSLKCVASL